MWHLFPLIGPHEINGWIWKSSSLSPGQSHIQICKVKPHDIQSRYLKDIDWQEFTVGPKRIHGHADTQMLHSFRTGWVVSHFALARAWQRAAGPHMRWWVTTQSWKANNETRRRHRWLFRGSLISLFGLESRRRHSNFHSSNTSCEAINSPKAQSWKTLCSTKKNIKPVATPVIFAVQRSKVNVWQC